MADLLPIPTINCLVRLLKRTDGAQRDVWVCSLWAKDHGVYRLIERKAGSAAPTYEELLLDFQANEARWIPGAYKESTHA